MMGWDGMGKRMREGEGDIGSTVRRLGSWRWQCVSGPTDVSHEPNKVSVMYHTREMFNVTNGLCVSVYDGHWRQKHAMLCALLYNV